MGGELTYTWYLDDAGKPGAETALPVHAGSYWVAASAAETGNYLEARSAPVRFAIQPYPPSLDLAASVSGTKVTMTATFAGLDGETAEGEIQFLADGNPVGSARLEANRAVLSWTQAPEGTHSLTAKFAGNADYSAAGSPAVRVTVSQEKPGQAVKTLLKRVIDYAQQQKQSAEFDRVIDLVKKTFNETLNSARAVYDDPGAGQAAVDEAMFALIHEIHKLGFVRGDTEALGSLIRVAAELEESRYTPDSWKPLPAILKKAAGVFDDGNALQAEVDAAQQLLLDALVSLRYRADKSLLQLLLQEAGRQNPSAFTESGFLRFAAARLRAQELFDNPNAAQQEVDAAASELSAVLSASRPAVSGESLVQSGTNSPANTGEHPLAAAALFGVLLSSCVLCRRKKR